MFHKEKKLIETIINYSLDIQAGQRVVIERTGLPAQGFVNRLKDAIEAVGARVNLLDKSPELISDQLASASIKDIKAMTSLELGELKQTHIYIMVKSIEDTIGLKDVSEEMMAAYNEYYIKPIHHRVLNHTRWLSIRYPNQKMAEDANMKLSDFEDYYYDVCGIDYKPLSKAMSVLVEMMEQTDLVHIKGQDTDIKFSIKDMPVHKCDGRINLPDGEVYTAPIKNSVNGYISYNVPTRYQGYESGCLKLRFKEGKIIELVGDNTEKLNSIFDTDEGARYIGEFAIGLNPYVLYPIKDILFDEKLAGSFHLTPGFSYENASNGNHSAIHWDLICLQTKEFGGGEIFFDGCLIRKDGYFIDEQLSVLNPRRKND